MNTEQNQDNTLPEWAKHANIYEVNIRQYTAEGTFQAFEAHLPRLKEMGVDILWFMPIFPISETKKKGTLGSYYAVSNFRETNPEFGTKEDFKKIVDKAHAYGMHVILDWVPNHTGWDHVWLKEHPEFYTHDEQGNIVDPLDTEGKSMGWTDVADLNYANDTLRSYMIADMQFWVEQFDIDGFRQDMAMLVPLDFWQTAIPHLRSIKKDLYFLAESEEHDHVNLSLFNTIYGWSIHHLFNDVAQNKKDKNDLWHWIDHELPKVKNGSFMYFTSNHDENSWSGSEIERMGEAHKAFAILSYTLPGFPLVYSGQEEPIAKRLEFFEKDTIRFNTYNYQEFYTKLNAIKKDNPALWNGSYGGRIERILPNEPVFAFKRTLGDNTVFVFINLSKHFQTPRIDRLMAGRELLTNKPFNFGVQDEMNLEPWQSVIVSSSL